jgi:hypothetical protein
MKVVSVNYRVGVSWCEYVQLVGALLHSRRCHLGLLLIQDVVHTHWEATRLTDVAFSYAQVARFLYATISTGRLYSSLSNLKKVRHLLVNLPRFYKFSGGGYVAPIHLSPRAHMLHLPQKWSHTTPKLLAHGMISHSYNTFGYQDMNNLSSSLLSFNLINIVGTGVSLRY